jgi:Xaa-Pro aminopeptidase
MDIAQDLRQRLARVRAGMAERGIGGLIVYYGAQHNMLRMDQLGYLTDFHTVGPSIVLVPKDGEPTLIVTPQWDEARARETFASGKVVATDASELARVAGALATKLDKPLGIVGREVMPLGFAREFAAQFNVELIDGGDVVKSIAATRTAIELERITRAAAIADEGFRVLCAAARVGMREYELAAEVEAAMQAMGAEDNFGLIAAGAHNTAIRAPTERRLEAGDVILGEITPAYRGFHAQLCRTFVLGEPTALQREKYDMLLKALDQGFKAAKPGQPSKNIAVAVNKVISDCGYGEYCRQPYMRTRGHGLGLGGVVPYDVTEDGGPVLAQNMTMVIHPNQYIPETGYMMLGDTVVIEDSGPRPLTVMERRLHWRAA